MNELYRAINLALAIDRQRQFELMQAVVPGITKSFISGFNRHPKDNRFRHVKHQMLLNYCLTLANQPDIKDTPGAVLLQEMAMTLEAMESIPFEVIDQWESVSEALGNGPVWQHIHKPESSIR